MQTFRRLLVWTGLAFGAFPVSTVAAVANSTKDVPAVTTIAVNELTVGDGNHVLSATQIDNTALGQSMLARASDAGCQQATSQVGSERCAQWQAATAAVSAAKAAWATFWLNVFGFIGLLLTLLASAWAARAATKAAWAAERSAEISDETARRQIRAYVSVQKVRVENLQPGECPVFSYELHNSGVSPAYRLRSHSAFRISDEGTKARIFFGKKNRQSRLDLGSGDRRTASRPFEIKLDTETFDRIVRGEQCVIFAGEATYRDAFGKLHRIVFRYYLDPEFIRDGNGSLVACERGNQSN